MATRRTRLERILITTLIILMVGYGFTLLWLGQEVVSLKTWQRDQDRQAIWAVMAYCQPGIYLNACDAKYFSVKSGGVTYELPIELSKGVDCPTFTVKSDDYGYLPNGYIQVADLEDDKFSMTGCNLSLFRR